MCLSACVQTFLYPLFIVLLFLLIQSTTNVIRLHTPAINVWSSYTNRSHFNKNHFNTPFRARTYTHTHSSGHRTCTAKQPYNFSTLCVHVQVVVSFVYLSPWYVCTKYEFECRTNHWWTRWPSSIQSLWLKATHTKPYVSPINSRTHTQRERRSTLSSIPARETNKQSKLANIRPRQIKLSPANYTCSGRRDDNIVITATKLQIKSNINCAKATDHIIHQAQTLIISYQFIIHILPPECTHPNCVHAMICATRNNERCTSSCRMAKREARWRCCVTRFFLFAHRKTS